MAMAAISLIACVLLMAIDLTDRRGAAGRRRLTIDYLAV